MKNSDCMTARVRMAVVCIIFVNIRSSTSVNAEVETALFDFSIIALRLSMASKVDAVKHSIRRKIEDGNLLIPL